MTPTRPTGKRTTKASETTSAIFRIAGAWRDLRRMKPLELSIPMPVGQIDTMDAIARNGPCSMLELSDALRIDASTATRAVDPLVQAGYVERRRSDRDARTVIVELSKAGRRLERRLTEERLANVIRILHDEAGFSDSEIEVLAGFLERMVAGSAAAHAHEPPSS